MTESAETLRRYFDDMQHAGVVAAYVFGSHARGAQHRESDVDVAVLFDRRVAAETARRRRLSARLHSDLIAALHRNEVDLVILNDAPAALAAAIIRDGRRVYAVDSAQVHDFERTTMLRAADLRPFLERTRKVKLDALRR